MENKLKVKEEGVYLGMGEHGTRYKISFNEKFVCYSDYEPEHIDEINECMGET